MTIRTRRAMMRIGIVASLVAGPSSVVRGQAPPAPPSLSAVPAPPYPSAPAPPAANLPPAGVLAPIAWQSGDAAWLARYAQARESLTAGDFAAARGAFAELARTATSAADHALAVELEGIAASWVTRDLAFVRRSDLGESQLVARAAGVRTTDEIAVLYTNAVFYGLGSGAWISVQTEPNSASGFILPSLGLAALAAGGVAIADVGHPLKYGVSQSIVSGLYIGLEEGIAWTLWNQARIYRADEWTGKTVANVIWSMSTIGAIAGGVVGGVRGTTPGRASFVGSTALWAGLVSGLFAGAVSNDSDSQDDNAFLAAAVGLNVGALAGAFAAGPVSPSIARVRFLDLGGLAGSLVFGGIYLAAADRTPKSQPLMGATAVGAVAGLGIAWFATDGLAQDRIDSGNAASPVATSIVPTLGGAMLVARGAL